MVNPIPNPAQQANVLAVTSMAIIAGTLTDEEKASLKSKVNEVLRDIRVDAQLEILFTNIHIMPTTIKRKRA